MRISTIHCRLQQRGTLPSCKESAGCRCASHPPTHPPFFTNGTPSPLTLPLPAAMKLSVLRCIPSCSRGGGGKLDGTALLGGLVWCGGDAHAAVALVVSGHSFMCPPCTFLVMHALAL